MLLSVWSTGKMFACKLNCYFSSHPAAFGLWTSTMPDNIVLNAANKKTNKSFWDFQTGIYAADHATMEMGQLT